MDWSVTPNYKDANHHPIAVLNGDSSRQVMYVTAAAGSELTLSAAGSRDPDEDELSYAWTYYDEPSSYDGAATIRGEKSAIATLRMPEDAAGETLHVILQVYDDGAPNLYAYRRLVVEVQPHETG